MVFFAIPIGIGLIYSGCRRKKVRTEVEDKTESKED